MTSVMQAPLTYSTSVPRHHVHRAAICEVFLTDILCDSYPSFSVGLQLPRVHSFYSDHDLDRRLYDPMLLLEAFRQASILISHRHVDAPMDSKFVFNSGSLHVASVDALTMGDRPTDGVIDAVIVADKRRGADVVGITLEMTMTLAGTFAATMDMTIQWMPPTAWTKLRARGREVLPLDPPRPYPTQHRVAAREVARSSPANVVVASFDVGDDSVATRIVVDQGHPGLFDHPLDHVPGAAIFEAMRQTSVVAAHELFGLSPRRLITTECAVVFDSFGELGLPTDCTVTAEADHCAREVTFEVVVSQEERRIAHGRVSLQRLSSRAPKIERVLL